MARITPANPASLKEAVDLLSGGRLVAFPTETVYGLGADATNGAAVAAIFAAKGRPDFNPLIIHGFNAGSFDGLVQWTETARLLATQFWPGPLTLVLKRTGSCPVSLLASAGLDTLAIRVPAHPVALELLRQFGKPVAAPSANLSGKLSPTTPMHVADSLGEKVQLILAGGKSRIGVESTVIDLTREKPVILRPGGVTQEQLEKVIGSLSTGDAKSGTEPRLSPGQIESHYAPHLPLRLNATWVADDEALLTFGPDVLMKGGAERVSLSVGGDLNEAASNLFGYLRQLDQSRFKGIAVMPIPAVGLGVAINDRLLRASVR